MANIARIVITVDNAGALKAIQQTSTEVTAASDKMVVADEKTALANKKTTASFESMSRGVMMVGTVAFAAMAFGIDKSVKAAMTWQTQQVALQQALKNTGQYSTQTMAQLNASTEKLATHGGFSVSEQLSAITQLVAETHSVTTATKLNTAATDLARGAHIEYAQAIKMVEGASIGQGRMIQKLIGVVVPITTATQGWTAAMKQMYPEKYKQAVIDNKMATAQEILSMVTKSYAANIAAYNRTTSAHLSNLKNAFEILMVKIGTGFLPIVDKVAQVFSTVGAWMTGHLNTVKDLGKQLFLVGGTIGVIVMATKAWITVNRILDTTSPILLAFTAIALIVMEIATHWKEVKRFMVEAWKAVAPVIKPVWQMIMDIVNGMKWLGKQAGNLFAGPVQSAHPGPGGGWGGGTAAPRHPIPGYSANTGVTNSVTASAHLAGQHITIHPTTVQIMLDKRVLAEAVVQQALTHHAYG
jgi:hypothetical protein